MAARRTLMSAGVTGALAMWLSTGTTAPQGGGPALYGYRIVNTFPHDATAFTQGLLYLEGFLYESAGLYGQSTLRKVRLETGEILQQRAVDPKCFAEGLASWGSRLIQLTWQEGRAFVYDLSTLTLERTVGYAGEGWGLTHDGSRLIMSDGSPTLKFLNPETLRQSGWLTVKEGTTPVDELNELEFIDNEIYANVWNTDRIARISPASGQVLGWIDLAGLRPAAQRADNGAVLNGIAYDPGRHRLFVTGKLWPSLFEIELVRKK
jgi:glutaminyl-peptide cyclotransferase